MHTRMARSMERRRRRRSLAPKPTTIANCTGRHEVLLVFLIAMLAVLPGGTFAQLDGECECVYSHDKPQTFCMYNYHFTQRPNMILCTNIIVVMVITIIIIMNIIIIGRVYDHS